MNRAAEITVSVAALFDLLNEHFYDNELPCPSIEVKYAYQNRHHRKYDTCQIVRLETSGSYQIRIFDEYVYLSAMDAAAIMLHEMAHLYNMLHEIKDTTACGYYHNKHFKNTAEAHGLYTTFSEKYAWAATNLTDNAEEWIKQQVKINGLTLAPDTVGTKHSIERMQIWLVMKISPLRMTVAKKATDILCEVMNRRIGLGVESVEDELDFCDELDFLLENMGLRNVAARIEIVNKLYDLCCFEHFWKG